MTDDPAKRSFASAKEVAVPKPRTKHAIDPTWLKVCFLSNTRDLLKAPLDHVLRSCQALLAEAKEFRQEGFVPEIENIQAAADRLFALINPAKPIEAQKTSAAAGKPGVGKDKLDLSALVQTLPEPITKDFHGECGSILVVDDEHTSADIIAAFLEQSGHKISVARNGAQALELIHTTTFDLVLLDIRMPEMDGNTFLEYLKGDMVWREIPVIMISGLDDSKTMARCIDMGADDYLTKPFNPVLLDARVNACLEKKRLRDQEQTYLTQLQAEQEKSDRLLLNVLPNSIADRLKKGESTIVDSFPDVTVLFADLVGFTELTAKLSPAELVQLLNDIFSTYDRLAGQYGLEKIKTIGDGYMVVGGLPNEKPDHAEAIAGMALDMQHEIRQFNARHNTRLSIRVGINTGPVIAGIIGKHKFIYDLWGDTVNMASRMESQGYPDTIQVTSNTQARLQDKFLFEKRGALEVKGKGDMITYLLLDRIARKT